MLIVHCAILTSKVNLTDSLAGFLRSSEAPTSLPDKSEKRSLVPLLHIYAEPFGKPARLANRLTLLVRNTYVIIQMVKIAKNSIHKNER